jgi:hypothetical protein
MSIESVSFAGMGAGTPLPQSKAADIDRTTLEAAAQKTKASSDLAAELAAGIGETDGDSHEIEEREADGRLPWEVPKQNATNGPNEKVSTSGRDLTGQCGNMVDVTG